ncbi:helix-turn-helix domain-containing protein [Natronosalvus vescus]|uniref:helix-turn-helix domain-containing protein n=1 Tax=Natronosalvus vescus TaxID=2953881 RepID=UPI002091481D|nr:helix-turn-helix domain-containing protein [Natronosalvus vescus]
MRLSGIDIVLDDDRPHKFAFTAYGTRFSEFERALTTDPTVSEHTVLAKGDDRSQYVVTYDQSTVTQGTYYVATQQNIVYDLVFLRDGEYTVHAQVPDRDALSHLREHCSEHDIPFQLDRLYRSEGVSLSANELTASQREALVVAYENGYFDSPRVTTLEAIGDEIGISRQAVADRLRRGHRHLIESMLISDPDLDLEEM